MKILWFTWKDRANPRAGGAEFINEEIAARLAEDGHQVILLVGGFPGCAREETVDGYKVIRLGNRWTLYWQAYRYYRREMRNWADLIVEEINTIPFMTQLYARRERRILLIYQLCREIWFHEIFFPLNVMGYLLEPIYLFMLRKNACVTESESTRGELRRYGFAAERTHVIPVGIEMDPLDDLDAVEKYPEPTLLSLGAMRSMKRTIHQIEAFDLAKEDLPRLRLIIAGGGNWGYKDEVLRAIARSPYKDDIQYLGRIELAEKYELMRRSHLILVTSVKEGWGLIVTEAASQGTPAVVYDVDGLRDSVKDGISGLICRENSPAGMARMIASALRDAEEYRRLRRNAWELSKEYTIERCYAVFAAILKRYLDDRIPAPDDEFGDYGRAPR
jgi:glycosyltransferase involved in cell wall biosynthesis